MFVFKAEVTGKFEHLHALHLVKRKIRYASYQNNRAENFENT